MVLQDDAKNGMEANEYWTTISIKSVEERNEFLYRVMCFGGLSVLKFNLKTK